MVRLNLTYMKCLSKLVLILILLPAWCFAQHTYKITDGELLLITYKGGMVFKKPDGLYGVTLERGGRHELKYAKLDAAGFEKIKAYKNTVFRDNLLNDIVPGSLDHVKFTYGAPDETDYGIFYSDFLFASFNMNEDGKIRSLNDMMPYAYIETNGFRFICIFDDGIYVLPTKNGLKVIVSEYNSDETTFSILPHKIATEESVICAAYMKSYCDEYYSITKSGKHKYRLADKFGTPEIKAAYDSIILGRAIIGMKNNKFDLYNYRHEKLNTKPARAYRLYSNCVQFLENNVVSTKVYGGSDAEAKKYEIFDFPYEPDGTQTYSFNIRKEDGRFYADISGNDTLTLKLQNTEGIESVYFHNNQSGGFMAGLSDYANCPVYFKSKDGKFGLGELRRFTDPEHYDSDAYIDYQDLQSVEGVGSRLFKLKKDNLLMFYPLQRQFRYKSLAAFDGSFARFELPNGKKGWLGGDGREYLDE